MVDRIAGFAPPQPRRAAARLAPETTWGLAMTLPYVAMLLLLVLWPIGYGLWMGSHPASYAVLWSDPIYRRTLVNTAVFLGVAVNVKLLLALVVSGFFVHPQRWIRWLSIVFILPWAIPSIPTILSFHWMLNSEWGMINAILFKLFDIDGPGWLTTPATAMGSIIFVHIWKYLPFWTLILLAGRLAIPKDLYEAAEIDGAGAWQRFRYVTWPSLKNLYITSTLLSTIWSLGDFNSVYLLTGGGPFDTTHVLATLGIRYAFFLNDVNTGVAAVLTVMPFMVPLIAYMLYRLGGRREP